MKDQKYFLLLVIGLLGVAAWLMLKPFLQYVLFALILGFVLQPLQKRLKKLTGPSISAFFLMVFAVLVAVVPLAFAGLAVVEDARDLSRDVNSTDLIDTDRIEGYIVNYTGQRVDIEASANSAIREFTSVTFGSFSRVFNLVTNLAIGITLMMFMLFYFLRDGDEMISWAWNVVPLSGDVKKPLVDKINLTTWAVIKGHVLVAVAQGLIAGLGLFIVGVPNYVFWTFIMVILGFIPIIGTILVWGPAAVYLLMIDRPVAALFLAVYGLIVVGMTDNVLRPIVVDRQAEIHPAAIIVGVIGGVYLFGAPGLFFGPIIMGVLKSALETYSNNYA